MQKSPTVEVNVEDHPKKWNVLLQIAGILALGGVGAASIATYGMVTLKQSQSTIEVVGSARKQIKSDLASWSGSFSVQAKTTVEAYALIKQSEKKVRAYLTGRGYADKDLVFSAIGTTPNYAMLPTGQTTTRVESYRLSQSVEVNSTDLHKIDDLSRSATELINEGVEIQSNAPHFYYTKIADLKLEVLSLAAKDAKQRADKIADNTGAHAGRLASAEQGVFQITPLYSTEVSGMGVFDTSAIDKEVMGVVVCKFKIEK